MANDSKARFGHSAEMMNRFSDELPDMPQLAGEPAPGLSSAKIVRHNVAQGEYEVSRDPHLVLTTVLGSCIACCLFDPVRCIGGLNHFLLAEMPANMQVLRGDAWRYGQYAMEVLVNEMLKRGATLWTMRAYFYGGANLYPGMRPIGTENAQFARQFLHARGITLTHADTGGSVARRLDFHPVSGRVRCLMVDDIGPALHEPMIA